MIATKADGDSAIGKLEARKSALEVCPPPPMRPDCLQLVLALSQSMRTRQFGEPGLFSALNLTGLYTPCPVQSPPFDDTCLG